MSSRSKQGAVTLLFVMIVMCLVGAISLSMYTGQIVHKRIEAQNAADSSAIAIATHGAQGLNMIAANNLSIGAALHVSGAMHVLGLYFVTFKIFTYTWVDYIKDRIKSFFGKPDEFQKWMDRMSLVGGQFVQSASGMTSLNAYIHEFWLLMASARGLEVASLNSPGSLAVPLQRHPTAALPRLAMAYAGIRQMPPQDTFCHTLKSSLEATPWTGGGSKLNRHNPIHWLTGPIDSIDAGFFKGLAEISSTAGSFMDEFINVFNMQYGFSACGSGLVSPLIKYFKAFVSLVMDKGELPSKLAVFKANKDNWDGWMHDLKPSTTELKKAACKAKERKWYNPLGILMTAIEYICNIAASFGGTVDSAWNALKEAKGLANFGSTLSDGAVQRTLLLTKVLKDAHDSDPKACYPYKNQATGEEKCLLLTERRYYCPAIRAKLMYLDQFTGDVAGPIKKISERHNQSVNSIDCSEWDVFSNQTEDYEPALTINDWSKQATSWVNGKGGLMGGFAAAAQGLRKQAEAAVADVKAKADRQGGGGMNSISLADRRQMTAGIHRAEDLSKEGVSLRNAGSNADADRLHGVGFLVVAPEGGDLGVANSAFTRSREFISLVIAPTRMRDHHPFDAGCPEPFRRTLQDPTDATKSVTVCEVAPLSLLGADNTGVVTDGSNNGVDSNLGSGAVAALSSNGGTLESQWQRTQFLVSQARISYEPSADDPTPIAPTSQLFWPAFRPRLARVTMLSDALHYLRNQSSTPSSSGGESTVEKVAVLIP